MIEAILAKCFHDWIEKKKKEYSSNNLLHKNT